jgi:hypothetical protein
LLPTLPLSAAAESLLPFKGVLVASESGEVAFPTLFVEGSGSGTATHLGRFTMTYDFVVDLATLTGNGPARFVAANGDRIFAEVVGQATPTEDPDVLSIVEEYTIIDGTGRFAGASGGFILHRLLFEETFSIGSFEGNIAKKP